MLPHIGLHAFVDEAGQRARTPKSSDHFVMSAVVVPSENLIDATATLASLRSDLRRQPGDTLHWRNIRGHSQRLRLAQIIGSKPWLTVTSVVVCKPYLTGPALDDDTAYLYTLRYLLERLSWLARDQGRVLTGTLAHIVRFKLAKLRAYEHILRRAPGCQIAWQSLDPAGFAIDQPHRVELLQLADAAASATFAAFEADTFNNTEIRYLVELSPRLYRRPPGPLTSYGLKMHPWTDSARAAYPWVAAL